MKINVLRGECALGITLNDASADGIACSKSCLIVWASTVWVVGVDGEVCLVGIGVVDVAVCLVGIDVVDGAAGSVGIGVVDDAAGLVLQ